MSNDGGRWAGADPGRPGTGWWCGALSDRVMVLADPVSAAPNCWCDRACWLPRRNPDDPVGGRCWDRGVMAPASAAKPLRALGGACLPAFAVTNAAMALLRLVLTPPLPAAVSSRWNNLNVGWRMYGGGYSVGLPEVGTASRRVPVGGRWRLDLRRRAGAVPGRLRVAPNSGFVSGPN